PYRPTYELHAAATPLHHSHDGLQGSGFSRAIAAHQSNHFAAPDMQAHAAQHLCGPIPGIELLDMQESVHCADPHVGRAIKFISVHEPLTPKPNPGVVPKYTSRTCG